MDHRAGTWIALRRVFWILWLLLFQGSTFDAKHKHSSLLCLVSAVPQVWAFANLWVMRVLGVNRLLIRVFFAMAPWVHDQGTATASGFWPQQHQQKPSASGLKASFQVTHGGGLSCGNGMASGGGGDGTLCKPHAAVAGPLHPVLTLHNHVYDGDLEGYNAAFREISRKENLAQLLNVLQTHDGRVGVRGCEAVTLQVNEISKWNCLCCRASR